MARIEVARGALEDLVDMIGFLHLPKDTMERFERSLRQLETFPFSARSLPGRWAGMRCLLGPWRWMLVVYTVLDRAGRTIDDDMREASGVTDDDVRAVVVAILDARTSTGSAALHP